MKFEDLSGRRFERWIVLERSGLSSDKKIMWLCQCDCGNKVRVLGKNLKRGLTKSCGCYKREQTSICKLIDLSGQRFGRLLVLKKHSSIPAFQGTTILWTCLCDCGQETVTRGGQLKSGGSQSCGCARTETLRKTKRLKPGEAGFNCLFSNYRNGAKNRNLSFSLSKSEFKILTSGNCFYCGLSPKQLSTPKNNRIIPEIKKQAIEHSKYIFNGIDRIDNDEGYNLKNCVSCCDICNKAKRIMTQKEFQDWIKKIYNCSVLKISTKLKTIREIQECAVANKLNKNNGCPAVNHVLNCYVMGAKSRGLEWRINKILFTKLILSPCIYCNAPYSTSFKTKKHSVLKNGIDRIDSKIGYTEDNVVPCCITCNRAKTDMMLSQFMDWIKRVGEYQESLVYL